MSLVRVTAGSRAHRLLRAGTVAAAVAVALAIPFNSSTVLNGELTLVMVYAVAALGLNLLVGYGGQISLGQGAFFGVPGKVPPSSLGLAFLGVAFLVVAAPEPSSAGPE